MGEYQEQKLDKMEYIAHNEYTSPHRLRRVCQLMITRLLGIKQCMLHNQNSDLRRQQMSDRPALACTALMVIIQVTFVKR